MSSRRAAARPAIIALTLLVRLAVPPVASAQDWESFAASSNRSEDALILQSLSAGDLDTDLAICRGLGRRQDQDLGSIFDGLRAANAPGRADRTELLLRWIIASVRTARPGDPELRAWVAANSPSVDALLTDMSRWRSPMLKVELMALAVIAGGPVSQRAILEAGSEIISRLRETGGLLSGEDTALALAFLDAARQAGTSDFLRPCAEVARLSRDEKVVKAAREAAAAASRS